MIIPIYVINKRLLIWNGKERKDWNKGNQCSLSKEENIVYYKYNKYSVKKRSYRRSV